MPPQLIRVDMQEIHEISLEILKSLEENEVSDETAAVALALTLGRVASPTSLDPDEQMTFVRAMMEYVTMYFHPRLVH